MVETPRQELSFFETVQAESEKRSSPLAEVAVEMAKTDEQKRVYLTESTKARNPSGKPGGKDWWVVVEETLKAVPEDEYLKLEAWARVAKGLPSIVRPDIPSLPRVRESRR